MLFGGQGLTLLDSPHSVSGTPEMLDVSDYSDYDKWLNAFLGRRGVRTLQ
jgi:hypothetical protein